MGVVFEFELNVISHIKNIIKKGFYHLKIIASLPDSFSGPHGGADACFYNLSAAQMVTRTRSQQF